MRQWKLTCFVLGFAIALTTVHGADDPSTDKLSRAKAAYEADIEKYKTAAIAWFDRKEETARKAGDKKTVDQVKSERQAFDDNGKLPTSAPTSMKNQITSARGALETAYKTAISEYIRAKRDDEAASVEKELATFQSGRVETNIKLADRIVGTVWDMPNGRFEFKANGILLLNGKRRSTWVVIGPDRIVAVSDEEQHFDLYVFEKDMSKFHARYIGKPGDMVGFEAKLVPGK